jgi:hypothetical protein
MLYVSVIFVVSVLNYVFLTSMEMERPEHAREKGATTYVRWERERAVQEARGPKQRQMCVARP